MAKARSDKTHEKTELLFEFLNAAQAVQRRLDIEMSHLLGISFSEYKLLSSLSRAPESSATRVALAADVRLTPSAVTRALKPLEKLGFVETRAAQRDARQSLATLTTAGTARLTEAQNTVDELLTTLPLDAADPAGFLATLRALQDWR